VSGATAAFFARRLRGDMVLRLLHVNEIVDDSGIRSLVGGAAPTPTGLCPVAATTAPDFSADFAESKGSAALLCSLRQTGL
jgi:hypothetical protein